MGGTEKATKWKKIIVYYSLDEEKYKMFMEDLTSETVNLVYQLFTKLCKEDKVECPYKKEDFAIDIVDEAGLEFVIVSIPAWSPQINSVLRIYIITAREITDAFREIWPDDPCRGDFALFGYGVTR